MSEGLGGTSTLPRTGTMYSALLPELVDIDLHDLPVFETRLRGNALVLVPFEFIEPHPFVLKGV